MNENRSRNELWTRTKYQYDTLDNLTRVDQKGTSPGDSSYWRTRTFAYDSLSRLLCAANPEVGAPLAVATCPNPDNGAYTPNTNRYSYDASGNVLSKVSPAPNQTGTTTVTTSYTYDALNRKTYENFSDGTYRGNYFYDQSTSGFNHAVANGIGRLTTSWEAYGGKDYSYDQLGRVKIVNENVNSSTVSKWYTIQYGYDDAGDTTSVTYPSGRVISYNYDGSPRTLSATDSNGTNYGSGLTYWPGGSLYEWRAPSLYDRVTLNSRLQVSALYADKGQWDSYYMNKAYDYGSSNNGNVMSITNNKNGYRTQTFTYDSLNRILSAYSTANSGTFSWGNNYTIDAWGNMMVAPLAGKATGDNFQFAGDKQNRAATMSYDSAGNLLNDGTNAYSYDAGNMLKTVGSTYSYLYDANGQRFQKWQNGTGVKGYWYGSGSDALAEGDGSGLITAEYVYLNGQRVARVDTALNLMLYSEQIDHSPWVAENGATVTANDSSTTDPQGGTTAERVTATLSQSDVYQIVPTEIVSPGKTYTFSVWLKAPTATQAYVSINRCCGPDWEGSTVTVGTTWQRYTFTHDGTWTTSSQPVIAGVTVVGANKYVWMWGAQLELGSTMGQYFSTTTAMGSAVHYYVSDHLKSTNLVISGIDGHVEEESDYRPYGYEVVVTGPAPIRNGYKFTGKERDSESSLDYFGARHYASSMGRFMTADQAADETIPVPLPFADFRNPQSLNLYSYGLNNPVSNVDPDGHDVHVCVDNSSGGQNCFNMSDKDYANLQQQQNGQNGINMPGGSMPGGNITCGGQVCGSATFFEPGLQDTSLDVAMFIGGVASLGRGLIEGGLGLLRGAGEAGAGTAAREAGVALAEKTVVSGGKAAIRDALENGAVNELQKQAVKRALARGAAGDTFTLTKLADGSIKVTTEVAGRAGGRAVYEKIVDAAGQTTSVVQRAYDASGSLVHVDPKLQ